MNNIKKPVLLVLAAGMGSRYGGLKQIDPLGPNGEIIIDYSLFDARMAGFDTVVFVIKPELEQIFRETVGFRAEKHMNVRYAFQAVDMLPAGLSAPEGRTKPWGTGHAVLCAKNVISEPFGVINSDDFYGRDCFKKLYDFLSAPKSPMCMVAFPLCGTLTENGSVSRGVCAVSEGRLTSVTERTNISRSSGGVFYEENGKHFSLDEHSLVSMNVWGLPSAVFGELEAGFISMLNSGGDMMKQEYYLPFFVDEQVRCGLSSVSVLETDSKWYGVTYREDKECVMQALEKMHNDGIYPSLV